MSENASSKILIIDDERAVRENIAAYLEDSDFEVFQAENGRVGLITFEATDPDVILVDIDMPEINGFEVLKAIRQESHEIPVVIVSGAGEVSNAIEASRLGAWDFVLKPIHNMAVVEHTILRVLEHRGLLRENREYKEDLEKKVKERTRSLEMKTSELLAANVQLKAEIEERRLAEARLRQAKERTVTLRRFSNRIAEFSDEARLLETALEELCANIYLSGAVLFHSFRDDRLTRFLEGTPSAPFLNKLPTFDFIRSVFSNRSQEIVIYNNASMGSPVIDYYMDQEHCANDIVGGHFAFLRGRLLHHHLFCFYRDALYAPYINLDIEYMKSMINEINTAYNNIQIIKANSWLEKRLQSTVPVDRQNVLLETHLVPAFEMATSVYPSHEIKAEWHCTIPIDEDSAAILLSDIPGMGLSDVMYNEMAVEVLADNMEIMAEPSRVMEILNDELQADFHPNRKLTLSYITTHGGDRVVTYNSIGYDIMSLVRLDRDNYTLLDPKPSPFIQVHLHESEEHFHQERICLNPEEILFGFTGRLSGLMDMDGGTLNLQELLAFIQSNSDLPVDELMELVIKRLSESFPKKLQVDDVNLIMVKPD